MKTVFVAAVALIDQDNRILLAQRPQGKAMAGLWEFPGGKLEAGELPEAALIRELKEELGIEVCASCLNAATFVSYTYSNEPIREEAGCGCPADNRHFIPAHALGLKAEFHLVMMLYTCRKWKGIPAAHEGQILAWRTLQDMQSLPMPPADKPLLDVLHSIL